MNCEFCKKIFSTKSSLNNHKKTAKYCLQIQNKEINIFSCKYCSKNFTTKHIFSKHLQRCKDKELQDQIIEKEALQKINKKDIELQQQFYFIEELNEKNKELYERDKKLQEKDKELINKLKEKEEENYLLKEQIAELKGQLIYCKGDHEFIKEIAKQPKTNNTNTTNNNLNITSVLDFNNLDKIKDLIHDDLNIQYIIDGQKGIARFVTDKLLKDENGKLNYICTDQSRQVYKYKDNTGEIKKDVEAKKLTNYMIDGGIKKKTTDIAHNWYTEDDGNIDQNRFGIMLNSQQSILNLDSDNSSFKKELSSITIQ